MGARVVITDLDILLRRIWQEERLASLARNPQAGASHATMAEKYRAQVRELLRDERAEPEPDPRAEMPARFRRGIAVLRGRVPVNPGFLTDVGG